jgi:hypothetical protein
MSKRNKKKRKISAEKLAKNADSPSKRKKSVIIITTQVPECRAAIISDKDAQTKRHTSSISVQIQDDVVDVVSTSELTDSAVLKNVNSSVFNNY